MANLDITKFGKSSANVKSAFIDILRNRFENDRSDGGEPSPLNAGIIGICMDMYATAVEDGYFNSNSRAKEMFVSGAKFDDSMYLHASTCQINDFFAKPSTIELLIAIPVEDIVNRAISRPGLGYKMLRLNRNTQFILDRFYFLLDYPVDIIVKTSSTGENIISCKYDLTSINLFTDIQSNYISGVTQILSGDEYYVFKVKAHQLGLESSEFTYTNRSNATDVYEYEYDAQLAGFDVWHRENSTQDWTKIDSVYGGVLKSIDSKTKFCYYRLLDGRIEISFSNNPRHWTPKLNEQFKVDVYVTEGSNGNFEYTSNDVVPVLNQNELNTYEKAISGTTLVSQLASNNVDGGINMPTLEDLRSRIIDFKASRQTIISDNDLTRVLGQYGMNLIRQRDDIYMRRFMTYALLKDPESGYILPGRTGEIYMPEENTINQSEVSARMIPLSNVYQFWLADDGEHYNTERFIAKQSELIRTSVTAKTNYFEMSTYNSHNISIKDNDTDKAHMVTFNSETLTSNELNTDKVIAFYGDDVDSYTIGNANVVGRTLYIRSMSKIVQIFYLDQNNVNLQTTILNTIIGQEYKFEWTLTGWKVTDLGINDNYPDEDGILPTLDHINIPKGEGAGTYFIFKNESSKSIILNYTDYGSTPNESKIQNLPINEMVKFYWTGSNWLITNMGKISGTITPTSSLVDKNWNALYDLYNKYDGVLMMCPYMIKVFKDPYFVALYDVHNSGSYNTIFSYNNYNSPEKFAINNIKVIRNDIRSNEYKISCNVSVSDTIYNQFIDGDINEFPIKIKIELFKNDVTDCFFELSSVSTTNESNKLEFSTVLVTDNVLHQDDMIRILNSNYSGIEETANIIPTNDDVYAGTGIIPNTWFISFQSKLRAYVLYSPDVSFPNEMNPYMLEENDKNAGFVITDIFETSEKVFFVRDVSDIFTTSLEVIKTHGILPKYPSDIPMIYNEIIYRRHPDGSIIEDIDGNPSILHNIGDPVIDESTGMQLYSHRAGDNLLQYNINNELIYDKDPSIAFIIKNIPLVSITTMLDSDSKEEMYKLLTQTATTIKNKILPKIIENNQIVVSLYNTIGPSQGYYQGSKNSFSPLNKLDVSLELNVKFNDKLSDSASIIDSMKKSVEDYVNSITNKGVFYTSELLEYMKNLYSDIEYIEFANINGEDSSVQTIKRNESVSDNLTPEYINVSQILDEEEFKQDGTIKLSPNIVINTIL